MIGKSGSSGKGRHVGGGGRKKGRKEERGSSAVIIVKIVKCGVLNSGKNPSFVSNFNLG